MGLCQPHARHQPCDDKSQKREIKSRQVKRQASVSRVQKEFMPECELTTGASQFDF
jgi:hypothetical protein